MCRRSERHCSNTTGEQTCSGAFVDGNKFDNCCRRHLGGSSIIINMSTNMLYMNVPFMNVVVNLVPQQ